ncbi:unnamed protein product [Sphagnum troendelagicum]
MDGLQSNAPPPFLTKTYDMVNDAATDTIVSWSKANNSFVVWNPPEFSQDLLPKYFKHNNFSSFVRQLNTYGFHKVDPDRWEFANERFVRGGRELLREIRRKKPATHSQQQQQQHDADGALASFTEVEKLGLEKQIEMLKREKSVLLLELVGLQEQQQNTEHELQVMGQHLQVTEQRQHRIMALLAKAVQTPGFLAHLVSQNGMATAARKKRRFQKEDNGGEVEDSSDPPTPTDGQIITIQTKGEVLSQILQLLSPSDASIPAIDNHHLQSLLKDYNSALGGDEGNNLNQQSGVTLMDVSTSGTEQLQGEPVLTDLGSNEGIVQLPSSPTSDVARVAGSDPMEPGSRSCQSGTRDLRDSNSDSIDLNSRGPGVSTEVEDVSSSVNSQAVVPRANDVFWEQYLTEEPENTANCNSETNNSQKSEDRAWEYTRANGRVPEARNWLESRPNVEISSHQMGQLAPG